MTIEIHFYVLASALPWQPEIGISLVLRALLFSHKHHYFTSCCQGEPRLTNSECLTLPEILEIYWKFTKSPGNFLV